MKKLLQNKSLIFSLVVLVCVIFLALRALLSYSLYPTHDGEYHVVRFYEFFRVLQSGIWYPRWAPDLYFGYGVPLFTFVYPLPNYVASFFHFLGFSFIDAFKLNLGLASLIGSLGMYLWARKYFGNVGGLISSVFYTVAPYHFVDMYIRGEVGEVWVLGLMPLFLHLLDKALETKKDFNNTNSSSRGYKVVKAICGDCFTPFAMTKLQMYNLLLASTVLALIIFSHNILALMFVGFLVFYSFVIIINSSEKKQVIILILEVFALGLGLSAIFWLPALLEKNLTVGLQVFNLQNNFTDLAELLFPSWGSGIYGSSDTPMSVQIGVANLLAVVIGIIALIKLRKTKTSLKLVIWFFIISFVALFFLMLPNSQFSWTHIPLLLYFQFPWRLLSLVILLCAFLAGSIVYVTKSRVVYTLLIIFAVALSLGYMGPAYYFNRTDNYYTTRSNFIDSTNSPGNAFNTKWAGAITKRAKEKISIISGFGNVKIENVLPEALRFTTASSTVLKLQINTMYFPGWTLYIDGKATPIAPDSKGIITTQIPMGNHKEALILKNTMVENIGAGISLASLLLLVIFLGQYKLKLMVKRFHG